MSHDIKKGDKVFVASSHGYSKGRFLPNVAYEVMQDPRDGMVVVEGEQGLALNLQLWKLTPVETTPIKPNSNFVVGDWYEATPHNTEGLTPGNLYKCVALGQYPDVGWIETDDARRCVYMDKPGHSNNDVEPVETPKELDPVRAAAAVKHQQSVTRDALNLISEHSRFTRGPISVVGGAPRDWDYNIPAQDIDIWLRNETFGDDQFRLLKRLFEPRGGVVKKITNNDYARDGEYIHYIYNVVWQDVDLQFIFVEDSSVDAVIKHVCCNFSEIAWDWKQNLLQPTIMYKTGRMARILTFSDDKGRSPRDNYIAKMAARYPDHKVTLPPSCKHLESVYGERSIDSDSSFTERLKTIDHTWGPKDGEEPRWTVNPETGRPVPKGIQGGDWVVATEDFAPRNGRGHPLVGGKPYKVERVDGEKLWVNDNGNVLWYKAERFRHLEPKEYIGLAKSNTLNESSPFEPGRHYVLRPSHQALRYVSVLLGEEHMGGWCENRFIKVV